MLYNYRKFSVTKELKNYSKIDCIIICQNIIDFAAVEMIVDKGIKKIINCVDFIYGTKSYEEINKRGIELFFLPFKCFNAFNDYGMVDIDRKGIKYNGDYLLFSIPEVKSIDLLIENFALNTIEYMKMENKLIKCIEITGESKNIRPVSIIISRGEYGKEDIKYIKKIIREENPSVICVDGGSDIAIKYKIKPDMVIGDMDSISSNTLQLCDSFIIHKYLNGICPGLKRIPEYKRIGFIKCFGTSEDAAILYCIRKGASKIYTLGFHVNTLDYIEKGRKGMASSLLIRLYYGHNIIDIKRLTTSSNKILYFVSSAALILIILYFSFIQNLL